MRNPMALKGLIRMKTFLDSLFSSNKKIEISQGDNTMKNYLSLEESFQFMKPFLTIIEPSTSDEELDYLYDMIVMKAISSNVSIFPGSKAILFAQRVEVEHALNLLKKHNFSLGESDTSTL